MKRFLALFLVLVMTLSLLAGCGSTKETTTTETPATETTTTETPATETETPTETADWQVEHPTWLCEEKTTITVTTYDRVNNTYCLPDDENNRFFAWLEDYTNVHIEWEILPYASYTESINVKLGAGGSDLSDIVMIDSAETAKNSGQSGMFYDLAPYWDEYFTNIDTYFKEVVGTPYPSLYGDDNGSIWSIAGVNEPTYGHINFLYNTEWLAAAGWDHVPETLDEFTELMYTWQEMGDLNGNGNADEVLLTSSGITHPIDLVGSAFNIEQYEGWDPVIAVDGVVECEAVNDNWRACLSYLNGLYEDGILDPEIASMSMDLLSEKIASDRVGCFIFYSSFITIYGALTSAGQADPLGEHYTLGVPLGSEWNDGKGAMVLRDPIGADDVAINAECDEEHAILCMKWLDVLCADPYCLNVRQFGFEGETWHYDENGELVNDNVSNEVDIQSYGCGQIAMPHYQTPDSMMLKTMAITYPWYGEQYENLIENYEWKLMSIIRPAFATDDEQALLDMCATDVNSYIREMRVKFVNGEVDIDDDAAWSNYVDTLNMLGLDTYIEAYQMIYNRTTAE